MKRKLLNYSLIICLVMVMTITSLQILALEGVITVLDAPVWKKPDTKSRIIQYLRKGDVVKIIDMPIIESQFIPVWDNLARPSYIKASHVYIYSRDSKELQQKSLDYDPTDYRKDEPLPFNAPIPITQEGNFRVNPYMKK